MIEKSNRRGSVVDRMAQDERRRAEKIEEKRRDSLASAEVEMSGFFKGPTLSAASLELVGSRRDSLSMLASPIQREQGNSIVLTPMEMEQRRMSISKRRMSNATMEFVKLQEQDAHARRLKGEEREKQALEKKKRLADQTMEDNGRPDWNAETLETRRCSKLPSKSSLDHKLHRSDFDSTLRGPKEKSLLSGPDSTECGIPGLRADERHSQTRQQGVDGSDLIVKRLMLRAQEREDRLESVRQQEQAKLAEVQTYSPRIPESSLRMVMRQKTSGLGSLCRPLRADSHGSPRPERDSPPTVVSKQHIPARAQQFLARRDIDLQVRKLRKNPGAQKAHGLSQQRGSVYGGGALHPPGSILSPRAINQAMRLARKERLSKLLLGARKQIVAAAYVQGGCSAAKLFKQYDHDNDGELSFQEWKSALRKFGKLDTNTITDSEIRLLFSIVDMANKGGISLFDFRAFLRPAIRHERQPPAVRARLDLRASATASVEEEEYRTMLKASKISKLLELLREEGTNDSTLSQITSASAPREVAITVLMDNKHKKNRVQAKRGSREPALRDGVTTVQGTPLTNLQDFVRIRGGLPAAVRVLCPDTVGPGDTVVVTIADGRERQVLVPSDVNPGDMFELMIDSDFALDIPTDDDGEFDEMDENSPLHHSLRTPHPSPTADKVADDGDVRWYERRQESEGSPSGGRNPIPITTAIKSLTLSPRNSPTKTSNRGTKQNAAHAASRPLMGGGDLKIIAVSTASEGLEAITRAAQIASMEVDSILNSPVLSPQKPQKRALDASKGHGELQSTACIGSTVEVFSAESGGGGWVEAVVSQLQGRHAEVMYDDTVTWVDTTERSEFRLLRAPVGAELLHRPKVKNNTRVAEKGAMPATSPTSHIATLHLVAGDQVQTWSETFHLWRAAVVKRVAGDAVETAWLDPTEEGSSSKWVSIRDHSAVRVQPRGMAPSIIAEEGSTMNVSVAMAVEVFSVSLGGWIDATVRTVDSTTREVEVTYEGRVKWVDESEIRVARARSALDDGKPDIILEDDGGQEEEDSTSDYTAQGTMQPTHTAEPEPELRVELAATSFDFDDEMGALLGSDSGSDALETQHLSVSEELERCAVKVHEIEEEEEDDDDDDEGDDDGWRCAWCTCDSAHTSTKRDGPTGEASLCDICGNSYSTSSTQHCEGGGYDSQNRDEEPPEGFMWVEVPEGGVAGSIMWVDIGGGREVEVEIPDGVAPGEVFELELEGLLLDDELHKHSQHQREQGAVPQGINVKATEVLEWLAANTLGQYSDRMIGEGFDDLQVIHALDPAEQAATAADLGMSESEIATFQAAIAADQAASAQALSSFEAAPTKEEDQADEPAHESNPFVAAAEFEVVRLLSQVDDDSDELSVADSTPESSSLELAAEAEETEQEMVLCYAFDDDDDDEYQEVPFSSVISLVRSGQISHETKCWFEGQDAWATYGDLLQRGLMPPA